MKNSHYLASLFLAIFLIFESAYSQNDLCENAIVLTPAIDISWYGNSTTGTFAGATIGSSTPTCSPNASQDVWYKFVATATLMTVSLQSYNQNYGLQVFENSCSGAIMGCVNIQANRTDDFASNNFIIGNTYYVQVFNSTISNPSDFDFEISILQPPNPSNDVCENAAIEEPCPGACAPFYGTLHGATLSSSTLGCAPNASQDVWVKFRADHVSNAITAYDNSYSGFDIAFEIYEGSCNGPLIACVNNKLAGYAEEYRETNFVINQTYYIRILNASNSVTTGTFALTVWYDCFPVNDLASNAELISPNPSTCNSGTFYRSSLSNTPVSCVQNTYLDVWYKFVPSTTGMTIFLEPVTSVNLGLQILEGTPGGNTIACVNSNSYSSGEIFTYSNYTVGQTYFIRVLNLGGVQDAAFQICITNNSPPANDLCPSASILTPSIDCSSTTKGFFSFSTISTTTPSCGTNASQDVWYQFNATSATMSVILSQAGLIDIGFQIFQGSCNGLTMGCVNSDVSAMQSYNYGELTLNNFVPGQIYFIRVFNASATPIPSTFHICVLEYATPSNDFCSNAIEVTPSVTYCEQYASGEINGASINGSAQSCSNSAMADVWYQFVATTPVTTISLYSYVTDFSLGYELFQSSCSGPSLFCSTNTIDGQLPILTVGQTYYVRLFNTNTTLTSYSNYNFCIVSVPPPVNNICTSAINITPTPFCEPVSGTLGGATLSGTISSCSSTANQDLWYKFVAITPAMTVKLYQNGWETGIDQSLELFESNCNGQPIACGNTSSSSLTEEITYSNFTIGQTYYIRVLADNTNFVAYGFSVCVTFIPPPSNDLCENAIHLTPSSTWSSEYGTLYNSTISTAIPSCSANSSQDVWYSFEATNTLLKINLEVYNTNDYGLEVIEESCAGNTVGCVVNNPQIGFEGFSYNNYIIGQTYYIRVFNSTNTASNFGFNLYILDYPTPSNDLCDNAIPLVPSNSCETTSGTFTGSTLDSISTCTSAASQDVWYQFLATNPTMSVILSANSEIDLGLEIKSATCNGSSLGCINEHPVNFLEKFTQNNFTVGQTYFIRVFHMNSSTPTTPFEIFVQELSPSNNDSYQNATLMTPSISCNSIIGTFTGSSLCSPPSYCNEGALQDVWFAFTATKPLTKILVTPESELDLGVEIYNNVGTWMYPFQCANSASAGTEEQTVMSDFIVGQKYWIRVLNVNNSSSSNFEICVQEYQTPTNDSCENATILAVNEIPIEANGTLNSATITQSIPTCTVNNYATCDVWFAFEASNSTMTVSLPSIENLYAGLTIYQNGCDSNEMGCANYQNIEEAGQLTLNNYIVGNTYYIRVFGESGYPISPAFRVYVTSPSLSTDELSVSSIALFPNPTQSTLNIKIPENQNLEIIRYSIINMLGQNVFSSKMNYQKVDVSEFSKGVYQVLLETNKGNWTGKFIKE